MSTTTRRSNAAASKARQRRAVIWSVCALVAIGVLFAIYQNGTGNRRATGQGATGDRKPAYQVGSPAIGKPAPNFRLASTTGAPLDLTSYRGKTVLLYFQEGLSCQPCWDQITDLEKDPSALRAAGIDQVVSITTDPVNLLKRKAADEGFNTPVLSDPDLAVSRQYQANSYGMMGTSRDGHSFVLVGPDGTIKWRADYGGAPDYTMYVPPTQLLADLKSGRQA